MSIPSSFTSKQLLNPNGTFAFLGTLAGDQTYRTYSGRYTYCREYASFINADQLREKLYRAMHRSPEAVRDLGQEYGGYFTTPKPGGGLYYRIVKKVPPHSSSLDYVIWQLGQELQSISGLSKKKLIQLFNAYGPRYLIHHFLDPVVFPQEKDIVIFPETSQGVASHYALFKETQLNWGGIVESRLPGINNPFISENDIFFNQSFLGNRAYFFRVKKQRINVESLSIQCSLENTQPLLLRSNQTYTLQEDGSLIFNATDENQVFRQIIDQYQEEALSEKLPVIKYLSHIQFFGVCYNYAFGKILETYISPSMPNPELYGQEILAKYFRVTIAPQKGALMVYFGFANHITHWAVYLGNGIGESKWGCEGVHQHRPFDVTTRYGNTLRFYEPLFPPDQLVAFLSQDIPTIN